MSSPDVQKTPEQQSKEAAERIRIASAAAAQAQSAVTAASTQAAEAARVVQPPVQPPISLTGEALEAEIRRVLGLKSREDFAAAKAAVSPKEPDWALLTEEEATDLRQDLNIPLIEHEVPSYMDLRLKDPEYVCVWVNRDQRRLGEHLAQGYEPVKAEHLALDFKIPLKFDSDGMYYYMDVIAMRVHKKTLFAKRRKIVEKSHYQLRALRALAEDKVKGKMDNEDPLLGNAFRSGRMGFYSTATEE